MVAQNGCTRGDWVEKANRDGTFTSLRLGQPLGFIDFAWCSFVLWARRLSAARRAARYELIACDDGQPIIGSLKPSRQARSPSGPIHHRAQSTLSGGRPAFNWLQNPPVEPSGRRLRATNTAGQPTRARERESSRLFPETANYQPL